MSALPKSLIPNAATAPPEEKNQVLRRFLRHRLAVAGLVVIVLLVLVAVFAPYIAPHDPNMIQTTMEDAPSAKHWLGLDQVGRDVFSRLIFASRISLSVGVVAVAIYVTIGTLLGAIAGYYGGWIDISLTRLADMFLSFPQIMLILVIVSVVGPSIWNIMVVLGLLGWPPVFRIVRGQFLTVREQDFVQAGRALGATDARLIFKHVLPNSFGPILVAATFGTATAILTEASLSFLGLGVQPPQSSWGNLLIQAQSMTVIERQPWLWVPPGAMIFLSVLAINFVGDGLRDALDPRLKR
ncbi:MAG TPA: oligopeptide ABC transporter permease [Symbiobacteriaceae bacterium]|jgi:peptide/nickel transport system permease protein|nr:oligopeptide ABC transporter permease [Symbiobacteriaceae bacterium]